MNILKTPQEKLMEDAGMAPSSPGMLNTPKQMLMQEVGLVPHLAKGGQPEQSMSVQDMLAHLVNAGILPAHYAPGGMVKNIATQSAMTLPVMGDELTDIGLDIKNENYGPAAAKTAAAGYSAFAPINPLTAGLSLETYSPELGDGTIEGFKAQEAARRQAALEAQQRELYLAKLKASRQKHHGRTPLAIEETAFFKK